MARLISLTKGGMTPKLETIKTITDGLGLKHSSDEQIIPREKVDHLVDLMSKGFT